MQLEAKAHIEIQTLLDLDPSWQTLDVVSTGFFQRLHRKFYQRLPEAFWQMEAITVEPGEWCLVKLKKFCRICGEFTAVT